MANESDIVKKSEAFLNDIGMTATEWLLTMGKYKSHILQLDDTGYKKFAELYEKIINRDFKQSDKGKLLEDLSTLVLYQGYAGIFECRRNLRTSSNEIDLQLCWTENARLAGIDRAFPFLEDSFLCECKNYKKSVDVTYIGKFFSLLHVARCKIGIMIAWNGIAGRSKWSDASGLIRKIALRDNTYIIPIEKKDFKAIYEQKANIFSIIHDKYLALQNEIDYSAYVQHHELEKDFKKEK